MQEWLIWSLEHEGWWRPNKRGYTPDKSSAGRYTFEDACKIVAEANRYISGDDTPPNETMVKYYENE